MRRNYKNTRGWRNCNPLNIRRGEKWHGMRAEQTDPYFCQFLNMSWGYRAAVKVMYSYWRYFTQAGYEYNIWTIIHRWAPIGENPTDAYIRTVMNLMAREGQNYELCDPNTKPGRLQLAMLIASMTCVETGCPPSAVPLENINTGFLLACKGTPEVDKYWSKTEWR